MFIQDFIVGLIVYEKPKQAQKCYGQNEKKGTTKAAPLKKKKNLFPVGRQNSKNY